jgi:hypothetical protein
VKGKKQMSQNMKSSVYPKTKKKTSTYGWKKAAKR